MERFGLDARAYSAWAFLGKPFLALAPGLRGYHLYLVALFAAQAGVLFLALRRLGAPALAAAALTAAHGASYPLRSVGLMSSPKVLWLLAFDVFVLALAIPRSGTPGGPPGGRPGAGRRALPPASLRRDPPAVPHALAGRAYPRSRAVRVAGVLAGAGLLLLVAVFLNQRSSGSSLWSFFLSHLAIEVPRDPARTAGQIAAALFAGGVAGALAYLPGLTALRGRGALVTMLASFAAGTLAFAALHPSGEKAMFALPALHCAVLLAGVLSGGVARRPALGPARCSRSRRRRSSCCPRSWRATPAWRG